MRNALQSLLSKKTKNNNQIEHDSSYSLSKTPANKDHFYLDLSLIDKDHRNDKQVADK